MVQLRAADVAPVMRAYGARGREAEFLPKLRKAGEAMSDLMRICDNCAFFGPQIDHDQEIECMHDGACRYGPPHVFPIGTEGEFGVMFPSVNREDWCGQWKAVE